MTNLKKRSDSVSTHLASVQVDDFLPGLGGWSRTLGQKVLAAGAGSLLALAIWPWQETVRAGGAIRPVGETSIVQSQLDGVLAEVLVKENEQVRKGQALATLDRDRLETEKRKLETELNQSEAQLRYSNNQRLDVQQQIDATRELNNARLNSFRRDLDSASSTLRYRELELKRYRSLLSIGAVAQTIVEEKQAQAMLARNDLAKARQALREQQARTGAEVARLRQGYNQASRDEQELAKQVDQTKVRLDEVKRGIIKSVIKAPKAGTVVVSSLRHAQQVIRNGEILAQIAPSDGDLHVKLVIPSSDVGSIKASQAAYLRISGCPYPEFGVLPAKVISISADTIPTVSAEKSSGSNAGFQVLLQPSRTPLRSGKRSCILRQGMNVQADIVTRETTVLGLVLTKLRLSTGA